MSVAGPVLAAAGSSPRALWYLTRGAGAVALLGLTGTVVLGVTDTLRVSSHRWPRFVLDALHRNVALITLALLALHIATALLDTFAPVRLLDALIPFTSAYRPVWLGLGALAFDLLLAVAITSGLRRRIGYRAWRGVHWAAYACWPLALVHGLGTGSDTKLRWMLLLSIGCVVAVLAAVAARMAASSLPTEHRVMTGGAVVAAAIVLAAWMHQGPLAPHWSRRAGTPPTLLGGTAPAASVTQTAARPAGTAFRATASGRLHEAVAGGTARLDIALTTRGGRQDTIEVHLDGRPVGGGRLSLSSGTAALGTASQPALYTGPVTSLSGSRLAARVTPHGGSPVLLKLDMAIDHHTGTVRAAVASTPDSEAIG